MKTSPKSILATLDRCCDAFTFPMLDNGYVYLAATRLSLYRSDDDWAMVIEVFGFSPRAALPDTHIYTFASRLHERDPAEKYATKKAHQSYLSSHPNDESRFVYPITDTAWQDEEILELVMKGAKSVQLRGILVPIPRRDALRRRGIEPTEPGRICTFELCRYLADVARDDVLATATERRVSVPPELQQILQLEEWCHPNVVDEAQRPSGSRTFQQLAKVLVTGDVSFYSPAEPANTHWSNWPDGGTL